MSRSDKSKSDSEMLMIADQHIAGWREEVEELLADRDALVRYHLAYVAWEVGTADHTITGPPESKMIYDAMVVAYDALSRELKDAISKEPV